MFHLKHDNGSGCANPSLPTCVIHLNLNSISIMIVNWLKFKQIKSITPVIIQVCNLKFMYTSKCMDFFKLLCVNPLRDKDIVKSPSSKMFKEHWFEIHISLAMTAESPVWISTYANLNSINVIIFTKWQPFFIVSFKK